MNTGDAGMGYDTQKHAKPPTEWNDADRERHGATTGSTTTGTGVSGIIEKVKEYIPGTEEYNRSKGNVGEGYGLSGENTTGERMKEHMPGTAEHRATHGTGYTGTAGTGTTTVPGTPTAGVTDSAREHGVHTGPGYTTTDNVANTGLYTGTAGATGTHTGTATGYGTTGERVKEHVPGTAEHRATHSTGMTGTGVSHTGTGTGPYGSHPVGEAYSACYGNTCKPGTATAGMTGATGTGLGTSAGDYTATRDERRDERPMGEKVKEKLPGTPEYKAAHAGEKPMGEKIKEKIPGTEEYKMRKEFGDMNVGETGYTGTGIAEHRATHGTGMTGTEYTGTGLTGTGISHKGTGPGPYGSHPIPREELVNPNIVSGATRGERMKEHLPGTQEHRMEEGEKKPMVQKVKEMIPGTEEHKMKKEGETGYTGSGTGYDTTGVHTGAGTGYGTGYGTSGERVKEHMPGTAEYKGTHPHDLPVGAQGTGTGVRETKAHSPGTHIGIGNIYGPGYIGENVDTRKGTHTGAGKHIGSGLHHTEPVTTTTTGQRTDTGLSGIHPVGTTNMGGTGLATGTGAGVHGLSSEETESKKPMGQKLKEHMPGTPEYKAAHGQGTATATVTTGRPASEKGTMEKIKEKLPGTAEYKQAHAEKY